MSNHNHWRATNWRCRSEHFNKLNGRDDPVTYAQTLWRVYICTCMWVFDASVSCCRTVGILLIMLLSEQTLGCLCGFWVIMLLWLCTCTCTYVCRNNWRCRWALVQLSEAISKSNSLQKMKFILCFSFYKISFLFLSFSHHPIKFSYGKLWNA